jgi:hypothetical protein
MRRILASRLGWIAFLALETLGLVLLLPKAAAALSQHAGWGAGAVLFLGAWTSAYFANYPIRWWAQQRTKQEGPIR